MSAWIRSFHPSPGARIRLLCFPHAGGAASAYHPLSAERPEGVEVLAVQYPGRQDRYAEPCPAGVEAIADEVYAEISPGTGQPLALFGHSMGAVVAYEVTRRLEAAGSAPAVLFVSGRQGPSLPWPPAGTPAPDWSDDTWLLGEVRRLGGIPQELLDDHELLQFALPALRADFHAVYAYTRRPGPRLRSPVVALTGDRDPRVSADGARAWQSETSGPFELHVLPGGHFYLADRLSDVVKLIGAALPE